MNNTIKFICLVCAIFLSCELLAQDQYNYIRTHTYLKKNQSTSNPMGLPASSVTTSIQYFDALGRESQSIIRKGSPSELDLASLLSYDNQSRPFRNYLPFATVQNTGNYIPSFTTFQASFYKQLYGSNDGARAYMESQYEANPLDRLAVEYSQGYDWRNGSARGMENSFEVNVANEVPKWIVDSEGLPRQSGFYPAGALYRNETEDSQGHQSVEFLDKLGRVIMTQKQMSTGTPTSNSHWARTVRIYDDFGNLRYVLPPKIFAENISSGLPTGNIFMNETDIVLDRPMGIRVINPDEGPTLAPGTYITTPGHSITLKPGFEFKAVGTMTFEARIEEPFLNWVKFNDLAFEYRYDERNRLIAKKIPGSCWTYFVYDGRDRMVMSQSGAQREREEWTFTKYDQTNRPILTGLKVIAGTREDVQNMVEQYYSSLSSGEQHKWYEVKGTTVHGYTNRSYPLVSGSNSYLTVTYYDDYSFSFGTSFQFTAVADLGNLNQRVHSNNGKITGSKVKMIDGSNKWLKSVYYYDNDQRLIQTISDNHLNGIDRVSTSYSYTDQILKAHRYHQTSQKTIAILTRYSYDHMNRLSNLYQKVDNGSEKKIAEYRYDEIGNLIEKDFVSGSQIIQSLDYAYNIKGWVTKINNGTSYDDPSDAFGMEVYYNTSVDGSSKRYDGNIGAIKWKHSGGTTNLYKYGYDPLKRLTSANSARYSNSAWGTRDRIKMTASYDANGNIKTLNRNMDISGLKEVDKLTYSYEAGSLNRLRGVKDASNTGNETYNKMGFSDDNSHSTNDYKYDGSGNTIEDGNRGISSIRYNHLNLPDLMEFSNGDMIHYSYDAVGNRLQKRFVQSSGTTVSDYIEGLHYIKERTQNNPIFKFFNFEEGRVLLSGNNLTYEFFLKDHLGNNRAVVDDGGALGSRSNRSYYFNMNSSDNPDFPGNPGSYITSAQSKSGGTSLIVTGSQSQSFKISMTRGEKIDLDVYGATLYGTIGVKIDAYKTDGTLHSTIVNRSQTASGLNWTNLKVQNVLMPINGEIRVYFLSATSYNDSFYDELSIDIRGTASGTPSIVQKADFYPFGLAFNEQSGSPKNNYLFNGGAERQNELDIDLTKYRAYDPTTGRWWQVDPLAANEQDLLSWSPYNYSYNNPIRFNDPNGDCPTCFSGALIGVLTEIAAQVALKMYDEGMTFEEAMRNLDGTDILVAGLLGGASGVIDGGASRMVSFLAKPRNQRVIKLIVSNSIDVLIEFVENVAKDYLNGEDIDIRASVYGALAEVGLGKLIPDSKFVKRQINNAKVDIKRLEKKISKGSKVDKNTKKLEQAKKTKRFYQIIEGTGEVIEGATGEVGGNKVGDAAKEHHQQQKQQEQNQQQQ